MYKNFLRFFTSPFSLRPHVITEDIGYLNFKKMKDMGMEKIIFDKDNTLTTYFSADFKSLRILDCFK